MSLFVELFKKKEVNFTFNLPSIISKEYQLLLRFKLIRFKVRCILELLNFKKSKSLIVSLF